MISCFKFSCFKFLHVQCRFSQLPRTSSIPIGWFGPQRHYLHLGCCEKRHLLTRTLNDHVGTIDYSISLIKLITFETHYLFHCLELQLEEMSVENFDKTRKETTLHSFFANPKLQLSLKILLRASVCKSRLWDSG